MCCLRPRGPVDWPGCQLFPSPKRPGYPSLLVHGNQARAPMGEEVLRPGYQKVAHQELARWNVRQALTLQGVPRMVEGPHQKAGPHPQVPHQ